MNPKGKMTDKNEKAPPEVQEDKQEKEPMPDKEKEKILGKFKSVDDLEKAYKEAEEKIGKQGDELRQSREFTQVVQPLIDEIRNDPKLFKELDERLRNKGDVSKTQDKTSKGEEKVVDQETRSATSDMLLAKFEEKHGIDKLPADKKRDMRQKVGDVIYRLTGSRLEGVDLRRLGPVLEDAYILANKDDLVEKSKLEALASAKEADEASIPGVPSSSGTTDTTLSSEEAKAAEKLGLTRKQYIEGKEKPAKR